MEPMVATSKINAWVKKDHQKKMKNFLATHHSNSHVRSNKRVPCIHTTPSLFMKKSKKQHTIEGRKETKTTLLHVTNSMTKCFPC